MTDVADGSLGERVRRARLEAGLTQAQLAGTEIAPRTISRIESGRVRPSRRVLSYIAQRVGKPLRHFLSDAAPDQADVDYTLLRARLRQLADDLDGADRFFLAAVDLAAASGDAARAALARLEHAGNQVRRRWSAEAESSLADAQVEALRFGHHEAVARSHYGLAVALLAAGNEERARGVLETALGVLDGRYPEVGTLCVAMLTRLAVTRGEDITVLHSRLNALARARDPRTAADAYEVKAEGAYAMGDTRGALRAALQALGVRETTTAKSHEAAARYHIGRIVRQSGRPEQAVAEFARARALAHEAGDYLTEAQILVALGEVHSADGRMSEAAQVLEEARAVFLRAIGPARQHTASAETAAAVSETGAPAAPPSPDTMATPPPPPHPNGKRAAGVRGASDAWTRA
jgi:transcriptional regulator with XRE-family HTH domain